MLCDNVLQVATGLRHSVVLLKNGKLKTAGDGKRGQLGRKFPTEEYKYEYGKFIYFFLDVSMILQLLYVKIIDSRLGIETNLEKQM